MKVKLDLRPRCLYCRKIPRGKVNLSGYERYKPYCSYHCQETHNLEKNLQYCRELRESLSAQSGKEGK